MKKGIALLLVLVLLFLGAYLGFGLLARHNYQRAVAELEASFPGQISSSYRQSLFSAELDLLLNIPLPVADPALPSTITTRIRQTIHHGPFIVNSQTHSDSQPGRLVQLAAHGTLEVEPFPGEEPPILTSLRHLTATSLTVHAPLFGPTVVFFSSPPRRQQPATNGEPLTVDWQGFSGTLVFNKRSMRDYDLDLQAPGLKIRGTGTEELVITGISARAAMHEGSHNLSLGTITTTVAGFEAHSGPGETARLLVNDLHVRLTSTEQDALLRVEEEISLQKLHFDDKQYGPIHLLISLANLDARSVAHLSEAYKTMQATPANDQIMALGLLGNHTEALLAKSPEIRIDNFSLATQQGECRGNARLSFNGEGELILNPLFLLGRLSAQVNFQATEPLLATETLNLFKSRLCGADHGQGCAQEAAEAARSQLQALVDQNILLLKAGTYSLSAGFDKGQATVNNAPLPLAF